VITAAVSATPSSPPHGSGANPSPSNLAHVPEFENGERPGALSRRVEAGRRSVCSAAGVLVLLLAMLPTSASADLRLCNTTKGRIGVAIGYKDASTAGWATEGWWNVPAQTCETVYKGTLSGRFYYIHAVDYDRGGEWAGQSFMCTSDKTFTIKGVQDCPKRGYNRTGFFEVDTGDAKDWTIRLTDPGEAPKTK
jgi:uncharacterized membrane protein